MKKNNITLTGCDIPGIKTLYLKSFNNTFNVVWATEKYNKEKLLQDCNETALTKVTLDLIYYLNGLTWECDTIGPFFLCDLLPSRTQHILSGNLKHSLLVSASSAMFSVSLYLGSLLGLQPPLDNHILIDNL